MGENIIKLTKSYTFKDDVFTVDASGMKHDYYKKDSNAYQEDLKKYGYQWYTRKLWKTLLNS